MSESRGGAGVGFVALAIAVVGGLWLYQREGGKVFDRAHLEPPAPRVEGVGLRIDSGVVWHDLVLTHKHVLDPTLKDVELTVVLRREDGTTI